MKTKSTHDPVYSPAKGIVVWIKEEYQMITIRYGRNYGFTMHHIVDIPENIEVGTKVENGTLLGYTEERAGAGWWEVELNVKRGSIYRTLPPYEYFSKDSKEKLDFILSSQKMSDFPSWTITEGDNSWIAELGSDEWWCSFNRVTGNSHDPGTEGVPETQSDFLEGTSLASLFEDA